MSRVSMDACPACRRSQPKSARYCSECGTPLVMRCPGCDAINTRTRDRCHHCEAVLHPSRIELGPALPRIEPLDDELPASDWRLDLREDAAPALPELPELPTLRDAFAAAPMVSDPDAPTIPGVFQPASADASAPSAADLPTLPETVPPTPAPAGAPAPVPANAPTPAPASASAQAAASDQAGARTGPADKASAWAPSKAPAPAQSAAPSKAPAPAPSASSSKAPVPTPSAASDKASAPAPTSAASKALARSPEELAGAKAQRRAAVRRSQLRRRTAPNGLGVVDIMVLEADSEMRANLCTLLEAFGYRPHVAVSVAEAEGLSLRRLYVAAFLCVSGDAQEAAALCRRLHDAPRGRPSALIAVTDRQGHTDRVRMQLAGADQTIFRPLGRGDVARALEACGLAMPHDPRQGAQPED